MPKAKASSKRKDDATELDTRAHNHQEVDRRAHKTVLIMLALNEDWPGLRDALRESAKFKARGLEDPLSDWEEVRQEVERQVEMRRSRTDDEEEGPDPKHTE